MVITTKSQTLFSCEVTRRELYICCSSDSALPVELKLSDEDVRWSLARWHLWEVLGSKDTAGNAVVKQHISQCLGQSGLPPVVWGRCWGGPRCSGSSQAWLTRVTVAEKHQVGGGSKARCREARGTKWTKASDSRILHCPTGSYMWLIQCWCSQDAWHRVWQSQPWLLVLKAFWIPTAGDIHIAKGIIQFSAVLTDALARWGASPSLSRSTSIVLIRWSKCLSVYCLDF